MDLGRGHKLGDDGTDAGFSIFRKASICCGGYATVAFEKVEIRLRCRTGGTLTHAQRLLRDTRLSVDGGYRAVRRLEGQTKWK